MYELRGFPEDYCCCPSFSVSYGMVIVGCIFQTSEMENAVPASTRSLTNISAKIRLNYELSPKNKTGHRNKSKITAAGNCGAFFSPKLNRGTQIRVLSYLLWNYSEKLSLLCCLITFRQEMWLHCAKEKEVTGQYETLQSMIAVA